VDQRPAVAPVPARPGLLAFAHAGRRQGPLRANLTTHSDAADLGYGGTLGTFSEARSTSLWEGRGLWQTKERAESITLLEGSSPIASEALLLLRREGGDQADSTARGQSVRRTRQRDGRPIPPEGGRTAPIGGDVARLGHAGEARWLPSAANRYADSLVRQWDLGDVSVTEVMFRSLASAYPSDAVAFPYRPVGEHPVARRKFLATQTLGDWGDGRARLFKP
jgi:hypothetical protein